MTNYDEDDEGTEIGQYVAVEIRRMRKEFNWDQKLLAKIVGLHVSKISLYETGRTTPVLETLERIARAFGKTIKFVDIEDPYRLGER